MGKVIVSNLPEGLTAVVKRKSDSTLTATFTGSATNHTPDNNIDNLTFAFQNSAFTDNDASEIEFSTKDDLQIMFMEKYLVYGASDSYTPEANDTFLLSGVYNSRPFYTSDLYTIYYKGCNYYSGGVTWVLGEFYNCPQYSTAIPGETLHSLGWSDGGEGGNSSDTIYVHKFNSLGLSLNKVFESSIDDGSIKDSITITFVAPKDGNAFTGANGDDFVAAGKVNATNVPEGLMLVAEKVSDTSLIIKFTGTATGHDYLKSINNLGLAFQNSAFTGGDASLVENSNIQNVEIKFIQKYEVIGATSVPEANGTYVSSGEINNKPIYSKGEYRLGYRDCSAKWVIVDGDDDVNIGEGYCPVYYTYRDDDTPPMSGWSPDDPIYVIPHNTIFYHSENVAEAILDDGTIEDTLALTYYYSAGDNIFTGTNGDDFIADGKLTVSNLPVGLTAIGKRTSDTTITIKFNGAATSHSFSDNIDDLTFEFQNSAFTDGNAGTIINYLKNDLNIVFVAKYEVFNAVDNPEINGTYVSGGYFNDKPFFSFGDYRLGYRGCTSNVQWVIIDGDDYKNLGAGYCPIESNYETSDFPPMKEWGDEAVQVYPHNSLYYNKTAFNESAKGDGSIDNTSALVIRYFFPRGLATFSGNNDDDFVAEGKVAVSNLPVGLTAIVKRMSDTTLAVVLNGSASSEDVNDLTFAFSDNAFTGMNASDVIYSTKDDFEINFHEEYYIASTGGDFATITEAVSDADVKDGDVLILASETFTENDISVNKALTFRGQGAGKTIIQANELPLTANKRIFNVDFSYGEYQNVTFENLTLQNGNVSGTGGAIYSRSCNLTIKNCEVTNNRTVQTQGGAIYFYLGNFIAENSTFSNNTVLNTSNSSSYGGGAIYLNCNNSSDTALIRNCTFSGNAVGVSGQQYGGALWSYHNLKIINSTFANNSATYGGGIYRVSGTMDMVNVLVANNTSSVSSDDIYGSVTANYSFIEDVTGATITGANNVTGSDPELSVLSDNGGSTQTCAISSTSLAKDAGTNTNTPDLDQRGVAIFNTTKDIGAYEFNTEPSIMVSDTLLEFGNIVVSDSAELSYVISAINLTNNLIITAPAGFEISGYSSDDFVDASPITIIPDAGFIEDTVIYVKYKPETFGAVEESIVNASTDAEAINIKLTAKAISNPTGDDGSVMINENVNTSFKSDDFIFNDDDGGVFAGIKIVSKETNGDLEYSGNNVVNGDICDDIQKLSFKSFENESGLAYATFTFKVKDNTGLYSESDYTITIDVNDNPLGADTVVSTNEDTDLIIAEYFTFTNTIGNSAGIQIVSVETAGDLEYDGTDVTASTDYGNVALFVFKPIANENGDAYATFTFKVKDDLGGLSAEIYTMTIDVIAVNDEPTLENEIPDGDAEEDVAYTYTVPENTFADIDADDVLTYTASLSDDSNLPVWLSFNGTTRIFSGTPDASGSLTLKVTVTDAASASVFDEFILTIASGTGIDDVVGNSMLIYPNPTNGIVNISIENFDSEINIIVTDIIGKVIINQKIQDAKTKIDLSSYEKGLYFIQLHNNNDVSTQKIIVE